MASSLHSPNRPNCAGSVLARRGALLAWILLQAACVHTTHIQPHGITGASIEALQSVAGRTVDVTSVSGDVVRIREAVLTSDSITGRLESRSERFGQALTEVESFGYKSRGRGIWDWARLGALAGLVATPILLEQECSGCGAYALLLAPVGAAVGATYGVIIGAVAGSTIRFQVAPRP